MLVFIFVVFNAFCLYKFVVESAGIFAYVFLLVVDCLYWNGMKKSSFYHGKHSSNQDKSQTKQPKKNVKSSEERAEPGFEDGFHAGMHYDLSEMDEHNDEYNMGLTLGMMETDDFFDEME